MFDYRMFQQPLPHFVLTLEPLYLSDTQHLFQQGDTRFPLIYSPSDMNLSDMSPSNMRRSHMSRSDMSCSDISPSDMGSSDMEAESADETTAKLTDAKKKTLKGASKRAAKKLPTKTPVARTKKPTKEEKKFERRVVVKPRARRTSKMHWKKKEIVDEVEAVQKLSLKRKKLASFESRFFYHYELPTICKLVHSKCPEMFAPPQLSTTPLYEYVRAKA